MRFQVVIVNHTDPRITTNMVAKGILYKTISNKSITHNVFTAKKKYAIFFIISGDIRRAS